MFSKIDTWLDPELPGVLAKLVEVSLAAECEAAEDLTHLEGCSCERSDEVLSANRDLRDGVEGPPVPEGTSMLLPLGVGTKTVEQKYN
jgi:hypothetical protein